MTKHLIFTLLFIHSLDTFSQNIPEMTAQPGKSVHLSSEGQKDYYEKQAACQKLWNQTEWENKLDALEACDA